MILKFSGSNQSRHTRNLSSFPDGHVQARSQWRAGGWGQWGHGPTRKKNEHFVFSSLQIFLFIF
jgi:hypothetical protein